MSALHQQGGAQASPTFDAAAWLHRWAEAGGIVVQTDEGLMFCVRDRIPAQYAMTASLRSEDREMLRSFLSHRQCGEIA